jgi:dihydroneopterin aldolase
VAPSRASGGALNRIFVEGLQVEAEVGCFRHEHGTTQPLVFDVSLDLDPTRRTLRDRLDEVVDYDMVAAGVRAVLSAGHVQLVESVAERLATHLLADPRVLSVRIRIAKPRAVPGARAAGVEIVRP